MKIRVGYLAAVVLCGWLFAGESNKSRQNLAEGTSLAHFTQVDTKVFAGSKPKGAADFEFLRLKGVKYILQADFLPGLNGAEREQAEKFGMQFLSVEMNASAVAPQERHVNEILQLMLTRQPMYLHCVLGRDRTSLLAGLYRIYFEGLSKKEAYQLMKEEGFRDVFFLHGLKSYFNKHSRVPAELKDLVPERASNEAESR